MVPWSPGTLTTVLVSSAVSHATESPFRRLVHVGDAHHRHQHNDFVFPLVLPSTLLRFLAAARSSRFMLLSLAVEISFSHGQRANQVRRCNSTASVHADNAEADDDEEVESVCGESGRGCVAINQSLA